MRVLVTGHDGYIGTVLLRMLQDAGHDVVGLDAFLFESCTFGDQPPSIPALRCDVRDVRAADLEGFDAVIHLAALSNDPLGNLNPECTFEINHRASVRLASLAKDAGITRFLYSSSCSVYGAAGEDLVGEDAPFNPVTPYAESKVLVEEAVSRLANERFSPTFLRNATAYGLSPRLRIDLVVNEMVAAASATGEILIKSDGTPWRPLVHVEDIARAFRAALEAPRERIHNEAFNIGAEGENYQIRDIASMVWQTIPNSRIRYAEGGGPDRRCYRVDFSKAARTLPEFHPHWTVREGIEQLYAAYRRYNLTAADLDGSRFMRIGQIQDLMRDGRLDQALRWTRGAAAA